MLDFKVLGLIWITVKRLFNKDHSIKCEAVYEGGTVEIIVKPENNIPLSMIKLKGYKITISSPAGSLVGEGVDMIDAFADAIKTVQR